jgi:hypothetical protein
MKLRDRSWVVVSTTTLGLLAACGPAVGGVGTEGETEGSTGASTGSTTNPDPTRPTTTRTDTSVGTGDVTGDPGTTTVPPTTTMPDDTTGGGSDSCCEVHATAGCNEEAVVDCVCAQEAFCCAFEWDQSCVDIAMADCMATCEGPGTTTDEPGTSSSTGDPMGACTEVVTFEMQPSEATYEGGWMLGMSMLGEGEIAQYQFGGGSFVYEPDIPCDDTWYIWARALDQGSDDSYFATLDGEPMPEAIFEGDCTGGGNGYLWAVLNWRDQAAMACDYVENPWAPAWTAGVHQIEFSFREVGGMGRILITNDQDYVPM